MIDQELTELFIRSKILLQEKLVETGQVPGSAEIKSQAMFAEARMDARIKQDVLHGVAEMNALRIILTEAAKHEG